MVLDVEIPSNVSFSMCPMLFGTLKSNEDQSCMFLSTSCKKLEDYLQLSSMFAQIVTHVSQTLHIAIVARIIIKEGKQKVEEEVLGFKR
jgi:hypothetical protein